MRHGCAHWLASSFWRAFLFVFKTCARRPPFWVLEPMAVARGAWTAAPDPPIAWPCSITRRRGCVTQLRDGCADLLRQLAPFEALFSWQGPPAIGSNCAVFEPDSADFEPRPALAGTGACAMFLTNNHKENSMSNIKSHRVPR